MKTNIIFYRNLSYAFLICIFLLTLYTQAGSIKGWLLGIVRTDNVVYASVPISIGQASVNAIVADTKDKRIKGLSDRSGLSSKQVMLFIFDNPDRYGIWMRDMSFPIDILWVDENMRVVTIVENAEPDSFPKVFEPTEDVLYIIETKSGFVKDNGVGIGTQMVIFR